MFWYATGYKTYEAAEFALIDLFATGEVDLSDWARIEGYTAKNGKRRFGIKLRG